MAGVEVVQKAQALVGEGPIWVANEGALYWVDIKGLAMHRLDVATGRSTAWKTPERVGALIPRGRGGFIACCKSGVYEVEAPFEAFRFVCAPDSDVTGNRFNDAKCDPAGRLWAGTMDDEEVQASGRLYRFDDLHHVTRFRDGVALSNGLGWSPDGRTMYFVETVKGVVWAYDYDLDSGTANAGRVFAEVRSSDGYADGLCVDAEGCVWLAHWGGARLTRFTPEGRIDRVVDVPALQVTSCAFGGDGLETLFITSAAIGLDQAALARFPLSGSVFAFRPGVKGLGVASFRG